MTTWIYAAAPEHGFDPAEDPPKLVLKDTALEPRFSGMEAAAIADVLNAETVSRTVKVHTWQAKSILLKTGEWGGIVLLSRRSPADDDVQMQQIVAAAITAIAALEQTSELDTDEPQTQAQVGAMLGAFVAAGALSSDTRDVLMALSGSTEAVWQPRLTADMVSTAVEL